MIVSNAQRMCQKQLQTKHNKSIVLFTMDSVVCPHCGKKVEISAAIQHELIDKKLTEQKLQFEKQLEQTRKDSEDHAAKKAQEQFELQIKRLSQDSEEARERNKKLMGQIDELLEENRKSKREKEDMEMDLKKKLALEEEKIREDASKKAQEEQHLKLIEKDKQLEGALKELEDMKRKLQQGSQQMQGEAFELEFEEMLRNEFPNDKVEEVGKGVKGGDVIQEVWDRNGNSCGRILWELKNTKAWSEQWVGKLKTDQQSAKADVAVIISEAVPEGVDSAKFYNNVWITKRSFVVGLASALRYNLIQIAMSRRAQEGKKEKMDILYSYLTGTEFLLRVQAIIDAFTNMQQEIEKEKRYFSNKWARDEKNIRQVIDNTFGMHGDLKGIMGKSIPQITALEALELADGEAN